MGYRRTDILIAGVPGDREGAERTKKSGLKMTKVHERHGGLHSENNKLPEIQRHTLRGITIRAPVDSVVTASAMKDAAISLHYGKQRWLLFRPAIGQGQLKTLWTCGKPSFWSRSVFLPCLSQSLWPLSPFLPPSLLTGSCSVSLTSFKLPQRPDCPQISQ